MFSAEREEAGVVLYPPRAVEREMTVLPLFRRKYRDLAESWLRGPLLRGGNAVEKANRVVGADHAKENRLVLCHA